MAQRLTHDKKSGKGSVIMKCTCKHVGQDQLHGKGNRVFNLMADGKARCTVCGKMKEVPGTLITTTIARLGK